MEGRRFGADRRGEAVKRTAIRIGLAVVREIDCQCAVLAEQSRRVFDRASRRETRARIADLRSHHGRRQQESESQEQIQTQVVHRNPPRSTICRRIVLYTSGHLRP